MSSAVTARNILITGLAFVFLYFGIDKFVHPLLWIGWIPKWMDGLGGFTSDQWLQIIGVTEALIGAAFLFPVRIVRQIATVVAVLHLLGVLSQVGWNDITVRDIGLLAMTVAVWFLL